MLTFECDDAALVTSWVLSQAGRLTVACVQARLLPAMLSALWSMSVLQYDPGKELMEAGARVLAAEASNMAPQARLLLSCAGAGKLLMPSSPCTA